MGIPTGGMEMKYLLLLIPLIISCGKKDDPALTQISIPTPGASATPAPFNPNAVQVQIAQAIGTFPNSFLAIDLNQNTFAYTPTLSLGTTYWSAFKLNAVTRINHIKVYDLFTNRWALGDIVIYSSADSTDGYNGTWTVVSNNQAIDIIYATTGTVFLINQNLRWLKIQSTFNGQGAFGQTPSFYMSEVTIWE
jgi:hypothetical protein